MKANRFVLACVLAAFASAGAGCLQESAAQKADRASAKAGDRFDDAAGKPRK